MSAISVHALIGGSEPSPHPFIYFIYLFFGCYSQTGYFLIMSAVEALIKLGSADPRGAIAPRLEPLISKRVDKS